MILFTSNVAASALDSADSPADMDAVLAELRAHFRPEFINRIDEIVPFHSLLFEDIRSILGIALRDVDKRLRERGLGLRVYQGAYEYLAEQGYSPEYGARELRRTVDRLVSNPLSDLLLARAFAKGDTVGVLLEDGELVFRKTEPAPESRSTTTGAGT
jgi:ATP-dependent Clp protease ATP-binding subunit ClpA